MEESEVLKELKKYIGKKVNVIVYSGHYEEYSGKFYGFDASEHEGVGSIIIEKNGKKILIKGNKVVLMYFD